MSLSQEQIKKFEEKLNEEKKSLENELTVLKNPQQHGIIDTVFPSQPQEAGSPDEGMDEVEEFEGNLSIGKHLGHRLKEINEALERIKNENYGVCKRCGAEIEIERLEANPSAETCIACGKL